MSDRFDFALSAEDLAGLTGLKLTRYASDGELNLSLYYDTPEQVECLAERHALPVEVDDPHEVAGVGIFRTVSISATRDGVHVFAVGSRPLGALAPKAVAR
jgi:hypothetical protein